MGHFSSPHLRDWRGLVTKGNKFSELTSAFRTWQVCKLAGDLADSYLACWPAMRATYLQARLQRAVARSLLQGCWT